MIIIISLSEKHLDKYNLLMEMVQVSVESLISVSGKVYYSSKTKKIFLTRSLLSIQKAWWYIEHIFGIAKQSKAKMSLDTGQTKPFEFRFEDFRCKLEI